MKIVYILDSVARIGGVERIFSGKMNYLADILGYNVFLITFCQGQHSFPFPLSSNINHIDLGINTNLKYNYRYLSRLFVIWNINRKLKNHLQDTINRINPDIIIGNNYNEPVIICKLKTKAKIVIESHCSERGIRMSELKKNSFKYIIKRFLQYKRNNFIRRRCDYLITLTTYDKKDWNIDDNRISVIPNFVTQRSVAAASCTSLRVICAGRLVPQKGYDMMIDAWSKVSSVHNEWKLYIFGEGCEELKLREQTTRLGLEDSIYIMPFSKNIYEEYLKSSIFVSSSRYEGFALVLIEAMECGVPCISFDCPYGPSDIIKDKEDGLLVEDGNVEALANAICWMIEHESERKVMGRRAKENIQRYRKENIMKQWDELFHNLCDDQISKDEQY